MIKIFLGLELADYLAFLTLDLLSVSISTIPLKFAGIFLCAVFAVQNAILGRGDRWIGLALVLSVGADVCLLLLDRWYLAGITLFFGVQMCHFARMCQAGMPPFWKLRFELPVAALLILALAGLLEPVSGAAMVYITQFFCNLLQGWNQKTAAGKLYFAGLLLFFCCDLCVGISNCILPLPQALERFAQVGMWLFYLPGQVLIVLSGLFPLQGRKFQ